MSHHDNPNKEKKDESRGLGFLDFLLPRALNTRRRYSAFRPVPLPHLGQGQGHTLSYTSITDSELANIELMEKGNLKNLINDQQNNANSKPLKNQPLNQSSISNQKKKSVQTQTYSPKHRKKVKKQDHDDLDEGDNSSVTSSWITIRFQRFKEKLPLTMVVVLGLLTLIHVIAFIAFFALSEDNPSQSRKIERCFIRHGNLTFCQRLHNNNLMTNVKPGIIHPYPSWKDTG